jgi:hypothetical protein
LSWESLFIYAPLALLAIVELVWSLAARKPVAELASEGGITDEPSSPLTFRRRQELSRR